MSITTANQQQQAPPTIAISLDRYLELACKGRDVGLERFAVIEDVEAKAIKILDPLEQWCHIEPLEKPGLFKLFPIADWKQSVKRLTHERESSERRRQIAFALEEDRAKLQSKIQRRRDIIEETIADARKLLGINIVARFAQITKLETVDEKKQLEWFTYHVFKALIGEQAVLAAKLQISSELIEEFKLLPVDPLFDNRYFKGSMANQENL